MGGVIHAGKNFQPEPTPWWESSAAYKEFRDSPDAPNFTPRIARLMVEDAIIEANIQAQTHGNTGRRTLPRYPGAVEAERDYIRLIVLASRERMEERQQLAR